MSRLVFLTCHLTGTGHLVRTVQLARTARRMGHEVTVITGGRELGHLDLSDIAVVQLPAVTVQGFAFSDLRRPDGALAGDAYMAERMRVLTDAVTAAAPDALITELFPLGRRMLADEFMAAIEATRAANPRAAVVASVRDIPEPKPKRLTEAATRLLKHYDGVLVHGDEAFLPLATTWPLPDDLAPMIHHVGYIARPVPSDAGPPKDTVLVSCGGGALGRQLSALAVAAAVRSRRPWHVLIGGADAGAVADGLRRTHPAPNLIVEPARPDFPALLARAACSISLCGYNTAVELAACTTPAILVPSEEADEAEQLIRARRMADFPGIRLMRSDGLTAETLAEAAEHAAAGPRRAPLPLASDDGTRAVHKLDEILGARP